jgi:hypothetical protein
MREVIIMKSLDQLEKYYESDLKSKIQPLEEDRVTLLRKVRITKAVSILVGIALIILSFSISLGNPLVIIAGYSVVVLIVLKILKSKFVSSFKDTIIRGIVKFTSESLEYTEKSHISMNEVNNSELFGNFNRLSGEDLVAGFIRDEEFYQKTGQVRGTSIRFSELNMVDVRKRGSNGNTSEKKIFKGVFYVADFNKKFNSHTKVVPDNFGKFFQGISSRFEGKKRVVLENSEFEKLFEVYGEDQVEARYILSASLMERLVEFRNKARNELYISFKDEKIYIAISTTKNLFEPKLNETLYNFHMIKEYYEDLMLVVGIVEMLNLNLRIWTKEY